MDENAIIWMLLASIVGGVVGARLANVSPWKGAFLVIVGIVASTVIGIIFNTDNGAIVFVVSLLAIGIVGGTLKISGREMGSVILGSALFGAVTSIIVGGIY